jgi:hypothetical protein
MQTIKLFSTWRYVPLFAFLCSWPALVCWAGLLLSDGQDAQDVFRFAISLFSVLGTIIFCSMISAGLIPMHRAVRDVARADLAVRFLDQRERNVEV